MNKLYNFLFLFFLYSQNFAANELYIKGNVTAISSTTPTLFDSSAIIFVNGDIINDQGIFVNSGGSIELTGNWTNTPTANNTYQSTGTEKFYGIAEQIIDGTMNGTTKSAAGYDNQFFDLKVYRNSSITGTSRYISLKTDLNIVSTLDFEGSSPNTTIAGTGANQTIIRTDASSHGNNGSLYPQTIYLLNPDPASLTNHSWTTVGTFGNTGGATIKYIEGKLKRKVSSNNTYQFPIGVAPASLDGMEGVSVTFTNTFTTTGLLAYIQPAATPSYTSDLISNGDKLFYDIGSLPATTPNNQFQNCVGTPDGHDDIAIIDQAIIHEWILTADASTSNYDLALHPGPVLDNIAWVAMGAPCQTIATKTKYTARNGRIGGDEAVGPTINYYNPGVNGLYQKPNGNKLIGQVSFSRFRIFGTINASNTSLPVELTDFKLTPVNNSYFQLDWNTASELNNKGFEVQRSADATSFSAIGFVDGNGTSSIPHNYTMDDKNVVTDINYYYRLKIIDFDGSFKYSNILMGKLNGINTFTVSDFYPNPAYNSTSVNVFAPKANDIFIDIYDVLGQIISKNYFRLNTGWNKIELNTNSLATAAYFAKISYEDSKISKKFIKK